MDKLIIKGGKKLKGVVQISGAKNSALPNMAASILASGTHELANIPQVADVRTMRKLLAHTGAVCTAGSGTISIDTSHANKPEAPYDIVKTMRASSLVLGPMLARFGRAHVSLPGGCAIGARPLNLHLKALESMGAKINLDEGYINAESKRLHGATINFDGVTVTGTENIMMAATLAKGTTVLENAAKEPEVADLANYLKKMGANIEGAGTDKIIIEGVDALHAARHAIISDRIEAGTFACAAAITGADMTIENCPAEFIEALLGKLREAGCNVQPLPSIRIHAPNHLKAVDITTSPYPGFATDLQAQFMACMTVAEGTSIISETIFENRFMHVQELTRLGADIKIDGHAAVVKGVRHLTGAPVMATDLRASASLLLAALRAEGTTEIQRIYHLDRGYENIEQKLIALGAEIERVKG
ncbi:MAG: UDP-N-acetylglucosamine 1-carboxyvinyltransferase [Deltaproteobacteria bacterium]|nr:UDP-N-acetylglucosamine 1-carboxyvinyltransferase [Deltaproteobacteria bacterium]